MLSKVRLAAFAAGLLQAAQAQTGNNPQWDRWCGKAYKPEYPNFDPGGQTVEPAGFPDGPRLFMEFAPRYNIYLEGEEEADFVVNAHISKWHGEPWPNLDSPADAPVVHFTINLVSNNDVLIANNITVGTLDKVLAFSLEGLEPSFEPYDVVLFGATENGAPEVSATSELFYLPEKESGSVTRLDNLNGGLLTRNAKTNGAFEPVMPYGFYASCDHFLCEDDAMETVSAYAARGLTGMIPLTTIWDSADVFEHMDGLGIKYMYDLRHYYQNLTETAAQVSAIKDYDGLYAYWGADEPDGWQDPFEDTIAAHKLIRSIDPYHPVGVTLNCRNYYFYEYTRGADFIMEDAYPIGVNNTWSKWGTVVNETYGNCGCDGPCQGNVQDVPDRLDRLTDYERWLGLYPKTKAHNPQAFHGEGYWARDPTKDEAVAMNALAFNHGAKSIIAWLWPPSEDLADIHGEYASVVAAAPVRDFIVGQKAQRVEVEGLEIIDAAFWSTGSEMLLSVVNGGYVPINETVSITLPESVTPTGAAGNVWNEMTWQLSGNTINLAHLADMTTYMAIFQLE